MVCGVEIISRDKLSETRREIQRPPNPASFSAKREREARGVRLIFLYNSATRIKNARVTARSREKLGEIRFLLVMRNLVRLVLDIFSHGCNFYYLLLIILLNILLSAIPCLSIPAAFN